MTNRIDSFIEQKCLPEFREIIQQFRNLIQTEFPQIKEEMRGGTEKYYGVPVYRNKRIIITVSPTKNGITFSFTDGKKMIDPYKKFEGVGNSSLNIRIQSIEDFDKKVMTEYIRIPSPVLYIPG